MANTVQKTAGGVIIPAGQIKGGSQALEQAAAATANLGAATKAAAIDNAKLTASGRGVQTAAAKTKRIITETERDLGRYSRGMIAATAASTGFFRAVSFASGAFLVGAAVGASIGAAVQEFKAMTVVAAQTRALIKATGGSANVTAGQVDALAKRTLALTGIDDELVKSSANILLCLEESAEALTKDRGWVRHEDLAIGDEILAYDPADDTTRWEPILDFYRYQVDTSLIRWQSKQIDVATTPHHRWWTTPIGEHDSGYRFRTTEEIGGHQVKVKIGGGNPGCFAEEAVYSDDLVDLAAWVFTEGTFLKWKDQTGIGAKRRLAAGLPERRLCSRCGEEPAAGLTGIAVCEDCHTPSGTKQMWRRRQTNLLETPKEQGVRHYGVAFCQSESANPDHVATIRGLVQRLRDDGHTISETSYTAPYNNSTIVQWRFARELGQAIRMLLPGKKLTPAFLTNLTAAQARRFLDILIAADGSTDHNGHRQFIQKDERQLDMVSMLAGMLGIRTSRLGRGDSLYFCATNHAYGHNLHAREEAYSGVVWCPQIRTQIFLARNRGRTFWTGNTFRSIRDEVGKGNDVFTRATRAVVDISSVFKTDLRGSAVQLGKALQDPVRGVTALRRSGITLSQAQRDLIKRLVETGRILSAQKIILGEVERQVGGTAEAIGKTLPGRLAIMRESAKNSLGEYVKRIAESRKATDAFVQTTSGIGSGLKGIAETVAGIVQGIRGFASITGLDRVAATLFDLVGGMRALAKVVTTAAVAFGTLKLALLAASLAQGSYVRFTSVAVAATVVQGEAVAATTKRIALSSALLRSAIGPLGITIAITGAIILLDRLRKKLERMPGTFKGFQNALNGFTQNVSRIQGLRNQLASASEDVSIRRLNVEQSGRGVGAARRAVATTTAAPGSLQARLLADQLAQALQKQRDAQDALAVAQSKQARIQAQLTASQLAQPFVIGNTTESLKQQLDVIKGLRQNTLKGPLGEGITFSRDLPTVSDQLEKATAILDKFRRSGNKAQKDVATPLLAIIGLLHRLPTDKEVSIVLKAVGQGATTQQILALLGIGTVQGRDFAPKFGFGANAAVQHTSENATLREQAKAAQALLGHEQKRLKALREISAKRREELTTQRQQVAAAQEQVKVAQQALTAAREGVVNAQDSLHATISALRDARQELGDTIKAAGQAVTQAVADAKSNLASLGQDIAGILGQVTGQAAQVAGRLGPEFAKLRNQILAGAGGPDTQKAAQQISFRLAGKNKAVDPDKLAQKFNDLSNSFAAGQITLKQFKQRVQDLVSPQDFAAVKRELGPAAAARLRTTVDAFIRQAFLITAGPQRKGGIFEATLVRPLDAVRQGAKDIAAGVKAVVGAEKDIASARKDLSTAQQAVVSAKHDLIDAERKLRRDQTKETKLNTRAIAANTRVHQRLLKVEEARLAFDGAGKGKPKPKNKAAQTSDNLVGAGAVTP